MSGEPSQPATPIIAKPPAETPPTNTAASTSNCTTQGTPSASNSSPNTNTNSSSSTTSATTTCCTSTSCSALPHPVFGVSSSGDSGSIGVLNVETWLQENGNDLELLVKKFHLHCLSHPDTSVPLAVLNYHQLRSPFNHPVVNECRGLVVQTEKKPAVTDGNTGEQADDDGELSDGAICDAVCDARAVMGDQGGGSAGIRGGEGLRFVKVVSKGFDRFYEIESKTKERFCFSKPFEAQVKEDGTFLLLFEFQGKWLVTNRHTFCREAVHPSSPKTFQDLVFDFIKPPAENLDPQWVYSLEMCSPFNQVIRPYTEPIVFLLGAWHRPTHAVAEQDLLDSMALAGGMRRPERRLCTTMAEAKAFVQEQCDKYIGFEGVVLLDINNCRLKLKSSQWFLMHRLKYKGWSSVDAHFMAGVIANKTLPLVKELVFAESHPCLPVPPHERDKLRERVTYWENLYNAVLASDRPPKKNATAGAIEKRLVEQDKLRRAGHPTVPGTIFCPIQADTVPELSALAPIHLPADRSPGEPLHCYCGKPMTCVKMRVPLAVAKDCHCGFRTGDVKVYQPGTYLWMCTDSNCDLTMEAYQVDTLRKIPGSQKVFKQGEPLGVPAAKQTKRLRLMAHDLLRKYISKKGWSYDDGMNWLGSALHCDPSLMHFAYMDSDQCRFVIWLMQNAQD
ncbi:RNA ligase [Pelomyxa schiedti]|nr:RNA ligase [Pelomyxa schiedti]